jgi:hypothetical protein
MVFHDFFATAYTAARLDEVQHQQRSRDIARARRLTRRADRAVARARSATDRLL